MLAAFFNVPPKAKEPVSQKQAKEPRQKGKTPKAAKAAKAKSVEPFDMYEAGTVHARFQPPPTQSEPQGIMTSSVLEAEPVEGADDPYEYLWQEANTMATQDEDDTDSCVTFDDDVSDMTEHLSSSPVDHAVDMPDKHVLCKRKAKASEVPVYSGPELWYEDDDFIE